MLPTAVALLSLLSPAVAGALPNKRQESVTATCFTDLGSVSIDNVPTSTATVTSTDEVVLESTTIPVTTVTPDAVTLTSTEYTTLTETETASTVTDTFSTTSTDYTTVTTTAFFTATETSTTDIYTTITTTSLIVPTGTFYPADDTLGGYPAAQAAKRGSKCKGKGGNSSSSSNAGHSVAQYSAAHSASTSASASASASVTLTTSSFEPEQTIYLPTGTTPADDTLFPASVLCSATVTVSSTSTITATGEPLTITADADTTTTTVTSTITTTSTVVPDDVSTTLSFSTTSTLTETDSATATETTTSTNTNVATSTTSAYSICTGSANFVQSPFVDPAGHTVELYYFSASGSYGIALGDSTSQYTCCNSCAALGSACGISYFLKSQNLCYLIKPVTSTGVQSNFRMTGSTRAPTGLNIGVTNGAGGYIFENYVG